jgi:glycosyltransferase involved in cell wall biosynthesis
MPGTITPILSIVCVSAFDEERFEATLLSLKFEIDYFELVVVCPELDEGTIDLCEAFRASVNFPVKINHDLNHGIYTAMNIGIDGARGQFIMFWNSGDMCHSVENLRKLIEFIPTMSGSWGITQGIFEQGTNLNLDFDEIADFVLQDGGFVSHQCIFVNREALKKMGGLDTKFRVAADSKLITKLWLNGNPEFFSKPTVFVETPRFSARRHRLGRLETLIIILTVLPSKIKFRALKNIFYKELGFLKLKLQKSFKVF